MFNVQKIYIFCKALIGCRLPTVQKSKCDINYTYLDKIADLGVFGFLFFKGFKKFFCMKTEHEIRTHKHMKNIPYTVSLRRILQKKNLQ